VNGGVTPGAVKWGRPKGSTDGTIRKSRKGHGGQKLQNKNGNGSKSTEAHQGGRSGSGSNTSQYTMPGRSHKTMGIAGVSELLDHIAAQKPEAMEESHNQVLELLRLAAQLKEESTSSAQGGGSVTSGEATAPAPKARGKGCGRKRMAGKEHAKGYKPRAMQARHNELIKSVGGKNGLSSQLIYSSLLLSSQFSALSSQLPAYAVVQLHPLELSCSRYICSS